jgi:hypothetical protein
MSMTPEWVKRRTEMILGAEDMTPAQMVAMLDKDGLLLPCASAAPGGLPITIQRTGAGVRLGLDALVRALLGVLAAESAEDPEGVAIELAEINDAAGPERDELLQDLVDRLGGATITLGATAARKHAEQVTLAAGPVFPTQQDRRDAA